MQRTAGTTVAAPDLRRCGLNYRQKDALWGYGLITIPLIGMLIFVLIPFGMSVYASFTSWPMGQAIEKAKNVGLKNYIDMFNNKLFWQSLGNTFYYMIGIPIGLAISLLLAYAMNRGTHYEKVFRVVYYVPVISSVVAITFVFQQIFNSDVGIINEGLRALGVSDPPNWMSHAGYTKWVIMIMAIWKGLGSSIILYIAGMQGSQLVADLPEDYAAAADACNLLPDRDRGYRRIPDVCGTAADVLRQRTEQFHLYHGDPSV